MSDQQSVVQPMPPDPVLISARELNALRADLARAMAVVEAAQRLRQASWPERQEPRLWRELDVVLDADAQEQGEAGKP